VKAKGKRQKANGKSLGSLSFLFPIACGLLPVVLLCLPACGHRTIVRPPELVIPETVNDLTLAVQSKGVVLSWKRVQKRADGENLDDLAGFIIVRATQDTQGQVSDFTQLATVPVDDRERFRKTRGFSYTDDQLTVGSLYRYRVMAFTLDGYQGKPSNTVEIVWQGQTPSTKN